MNKAQFWRIIDAARKKAGRWQDMREPLLDRLSSLPIQDIVTWEQILEKYRSLARREKLWAAAASMMNGCSDDSFDYFLGWLIAQGKEVYLAALRDPDSLADMEAVKRLAQEVIESDGMAPMKGYFEEPRFEEILGAAYYACKRARGDAVGFYRLVNDSPLSARTLDSMVREIVYAPDIDEKWNGSDLTTEDMWKQLGKLCPRLYRLFREAAELEPDESQKPSIRKILALNSPSAAVTADEKPHTAKGAR